MSQIKRKDETQQPIATDGDGCGVSTGKLAKEMINKGKKRANGRSPLRNGSFREKLNGKKAVSKKRGR